MELTLAIKHLYPTLWDEDFMVLNDSQWEPDYIQWKNQEITQPTKSELDTAWSEVEAIQLVEQAKKQKAIDIEKIATITDQINQLALIMEEMVLERETISPTMQNGLDMTNWIKNILNK
jgi:hypothetical protein